MSVLDAAPLGPLCAFGASVTWAIGSSVYSQLTRTYSVFAINFVRAGLALPLFVLIAMLYSGGISEGLARYQAVNLSQVGWFALSMASSYGFGDVCFLWSTKYLGVPGALAISSVYPIWTVLAGYFFSNEILTAYQVLGLLMTLSGMVAVILNAPGAAPQKTSSKKTQIRFSWTGLAFAIAASIGWAANGYSVARGGVNMDPFIGNSIRMLLAILITGILGRALTPQAQVCLPKREIWKYLGIFIFESFGGSIVYLYGLSHSPLALGVTLSALAPVVSVPVALVLRTEKFSAIRTLSILWVVAGICLLVS